jgi:transmembrane sensor
VADSIDWVLVARYLNHSCTAEERRAVMAWAAQDPANARGLDEARRVWEATGELPDSWDVVRGWLALEERLDAIDAGRTAGATAAPRRGRPAHAIRVLRTRGTHALLAAAAAIVVAVGVTVTSLRLRAPLAVAGREYATAAGEQLNVTLIDGTRVALAPESRLRVPAAYGRATREVALDGEAFFRVVHDSARPFHVRARGADARDVGTAFDVRAYGSDSAVEVAVAEGRVAVSAVATAGRQGVTSSLGAGDLATVTPAGHIGMVHEADLGPFVGWTDGELVFHETPLGDVVPVLERWYGVTIVVTDPALARRPIYATYTMQSMTDVLTQVTSTVGAHYTQQGRVIKIAPGLQATQ